MYECDPRCHAYVGDALWSTYAFPRLIFLIYRLCPQSIRWESTIPNLVGLTCHQAHRSQKLGTRSSISLHQSNDWNTYVQAWRLWEWSEWIRNYITWKGINGVWEVSVDELKYAEIKNRGKTSKIPTLFHHRHLIAPSFELRTTVLVTANWAVESTSFWKKINYIVNLFHEIFAIFKRMKVSCQNVKY